MSTIDITPTWTGLLPVLLEIIRANRSGSPIAMEELVRMAQLADSHVELYHKTQLLLDLLGAACEALHEHGDEGTLPYLNQQMELLSL